MPDITDLTVSFFSDVFLDPKKRVFIGYLVSALILAVGWLVIAQRQHWRVALSQIFSRKVWLSDSAKTDYLLLISNRLIMSLISPVLLGQLAVATFWFESMHSWLTPTVAAHWPQWLIMTLFTCVLFLLDDASRYWVHRWLHRSPILWQFHRVHHTATTLTPLTIFRTHPVEGILFSLRGALVQGFCIGTFVFLFGSQVDLLSLFGVNIFLFLLNVTGANLRHSSIPIPYPNAVERWLISPAQHQIHHSTDPQHFDRNFGVFLAIWDRLGGTLYHSDTNTQLDFGIIENGKKAHQSLMQVYLSPFSRTSQLLKKRLGITPLKSN